MEEGLEEELLLRQWGDGYLQFDNTLPPIMYATIDRSYVSSALVAGINKAFGFENQPLR